jgi:hypothetical protein
VRCVCGASQGQAMSRVWDGIVGDRDEREAERGVRGGERMPQVLECRCRVRDAPSHVHRAVRTVDGGV